MSSGCARTLETEMTAMRIVMEHEAKRGCHAYDVHEKNLGYDVIGLDLQSKATGKIQSSNERQSRATASD